jgi:hypothetical protein
MGGASFEGKDTAADGLESPGSAEQGEEFVDGDACPVYEAPKCSRRKFSMVGNRERVGVAGLDHDYVAATAAIGCEAGTLES